ncbi:hypothetical protein DVA67_009425 [Solirubrobacter sp. CPCC 204708]|uniref:Uncharacterized protein n=1 Tax=Solirubrobacter deserti TaxID=2282478 RepID=A0ABT4RTA9_9ACTN|nr:hypothetical protein [Solirubrobacter deserti]MBE2316195.1 hypothetical protein [Solirubrobacter deserti]MDA0141821.1 hypothetical protein [Solirubrobacter deserti]
MTAGLVLAVVMLALGATCVLPIIGRIHDARRGAQLAAGGFAGLGIALLTLALFVPLLVVRSDELLAAIAVLGHYGLAANVMCLVIAAVIARAGKPRVA